MPARRRTTEIRLSDVARAAGVSPATASRVLNGSSRQVSAQHAARVRDAAARLGYAVDLRAQATARGTSSMIAVVVPSLTDDEAMRAAAEVHTVAEDLGYTASVWVCPPDPERASEIIRRLRGQRIRAIFMVVPQASLAGEAVLRELAQYRAHGGVTVAIDCLRPRAAARDARSGMIHSVIAGS